MGFMYSGKQVIRAGENLLDDKLQTSDPTCFDESMNILSYWRLSHEQPLEQAFIILQQIALSRDKRTIFAKRLKRYASIVAKLRRYNSMKLKNVQDIGACRAIVHSQKQLYQLTRELRNNDHFRYSGGDFKFKDYIKEPKEDGYRGYHLMGIFGLTAKDTRTIEIQIRTRLQHDWATALEIVDLFTGQALKSNQGASDWKEFFCCVAELFSVMDGIHRFRSLAPDAKLNSFRAEVGKQVRYIELCGRVRDLGTNLSVLPRLQAFAQSLEVVDKHLNATPVIGYILLQIDTSERKVWSTIYSDDMMKSAEKNYVDAEKNASASPNLVVALVSSTAVGGIKEAYPNYFADSKNFVSLVKIITKSALPKDRLPNLFGPLNFRSP